MNKILTSCVLAACVSWNAMVGAANIKDHPTVAVMNFGNKAVISRGLRIDDMAMATEYAIYQLSNCDWFDLVDYEQLKTMADIQRINLSGFIDQSTAAQMGKVLGAKFIVVGNVTGLTTKESQVAIKAGEHGGAGNYQHIVTANVTLRIVDVETGRIVVAGLGKGSSTSTNTEIGFNLYRNRETLVAKDVTNQTVTTKRDEEKTNTNTVKRDEENTSTNNKHSDKDNSWENNKSSLNKTTDNSGSTSNYNGNTTKTNTNSGSSNSNYNRVTTDNSDYNDNKNDGYQDKEYWNAMKQEQANSHNNQTTDYSQKTTQDIITSHMDGKVIAGSQQSMVDDKAHFDLHILEGGQGGGSAVKNNQTDVSTKTTQGGSSSDYSEVEAGTYNKNGSSFSNASGQASEIYKDNANLNTGYQNNSKESTVTNNSSSQNQFKNTTDSTVSTDKITDKGSTNSSDRTVNTNKANNSTTNVATDKANNSVNSVGENKYYTYSRDKETYSISIGTVQVSDVQVRNAIGKAVRDAVYGKTGIMTTLNGGKQLKIKTGF